MFEKVGFVIEKRLWSGEFDLFAGYHENGVCAVEAQPIVFKKTENIERSSTPCMRLKADQVQQLFNELWRLGIRPSDGTGNSGHIQALSYHLEDMRKLVFKDIETK